VPILSALDDFILHADDSMTFVMPAVVVPAAPSPSHPPRSAIAPTINSHAAPTEATDHPMPPAPVTTGSGGSTEPGALNVGNGGNGPVTGNGPGVVSLGPPPPPVVPVRPGGDLKWPTRTTYVAPVYPPLAKLSRIEGSVIVEATLDEAGVVRNVRVLRSSALFDQAAVDAVSQWRYAPTRLNGVAVPVVLTVTVTFTMR
jgi:protein TonB